MCLLLLHGTMPDDLGTYAANTCPLDVKQSAVLLSARRHQPGHGYTSPDCDLGIPYVTVRSLVVLACRAPYSFPVHHWTSSGVPTAVVASLELRRCLPGLLRLHEPAVLILTLGDPRQLHVRCSRCPAARMTSP